MTDQSNTQLGFPLAFEAYSYGTIDWDNPPLTKEFPYLPDELLTILIDYCIANELLAFMLFASNNSSRIDSFITKKIYTNYQQIQQRKRYFVQKTIRKQGIIIGINGDVRYFLRLFKQFFWSVNGISIEQANLKVKDMLDAESLALIAPLACKNLLFISQGGDPIYLLQRNNYSQVIDVQGLQKIL